VGEGTKAHKAKIQYIFAKFNGEQKEKGEEEGASLKNNVGGKQYMVYCCPPDPLVVKIPFLGSGILGFWFSGFWAKIQDSVWDC